MKLHSIVSHTERFPVMAPAKKEYNFKVQLRPANWDEKLKNTHDWANANVKPYIAYVLPHKYAPLEVQFAAEADFASIYETSIRMAKNNLQMWDFLEEEGIKYPPRVRAAVLAKMFEMIKSDTFPEIDFSGDEPVVNLEFSVVA